LPLTFEPIDAIKGRPEVLEHLGVTRDDVAERIGGQRNCGPRRAVRRRLVTGHGGAVGVGKPRADDQTADAVIFPQVRQVGFGPPMHGGELIGVQLDPAAGVAVPGQSVQHGPLPFVEGVRCLAESGQGDGHESEQGDDKTANRHDAVNVRMPPPPGKNSPARIRLQPVRQAIRR
jgi:hypothetical protein